MKKVLATAAGLMLVGTMVSTAAAKIDLTGDARVRGYIERNYDGGIKDDQTGLRTNKTDDKIATRFRVKIKASTESGVYGEARFKLSDGVMDGGQQTGDAITGDYAYLGVPLGPITFEGGHKPIDVTKFFLFDVDSDVVLLKYANDMTIVQAFYFKASEYELTGTDLIDDDDINSYAAYLNQKFGGDMSLTAYLAYQDDERVSDNSGLTGTVQFSAPSLGPVGLVAEFSYQDEDVTAKNAAGKSDTGYGGYVQGAMNFGAASLALNVGFTDGGFIADDDFGFLMIGGASSITPAITANVGAVGATPYDTFWVGGVFGFKVTEKLSLTGNLVYVDADVVDAFEISGKLSYVIVDGATFTTDVGYLSLDADNNTSTDDPWGLAFTMEIDF